MGNAPSIRSFSIFNSQFSRFFIEEEYTLHRLFQQPRGFNRQLEGRVVFIVLHRHDGLPRYPEQLCHVLLPQAARLAEFFNVVLHLQRRFNNLHPNTFTIPEGYYPKVGEGAKITSLVDPNSKMSKSDPNPNGYILLMDKPEDIMRKFKRAVTDSDSRIIFDPQNKPGVSNLLQIYALATGKTIEQAAAEFDGKGYGEFKPAVGEAVVELLRPIREKTTDLLNNKDYLEQVYREGAQKASYLARKTLDKVYRKVGFVAR